MSFVLSAVLIVLLFSGMQANKQWLAASPIQTLIGGFVGSLIFLCSLTVIFHISFRWKWVIWTIIRVIFCRPLVTWKHSRLEKIFKPNYSLKVGVQLRYRATLIPGCFKMGFCFSGSLLFIHIRIFGDGASCLCHFCVCVIYCNYLYYVTFRNSDEFVFHFSLILSTITLYYMNSISQKTYAVSAPAPPPVPARKKKHWEACM